MNNKIYLGDQILNNEVGKIEEGFCTIEDELFYKIENYDYMSDFFMTITSSSNHWMFISSSGGLTAGRVNSESAIFPYYTDDRITENSSNTGPKTIVLVSKGDKTYLWEPFSDNKTNVYSTKRSLFKNIYGNMIKFTEENKSLGITFSYYWMNSKKFGLVRRSVIENINTESVDIDIVDGLRNVLPAGVESQVQNEFSNLLNGYKRNQLIEPCLGLFTLSATLTDLAEPSESLKANTVWQYGLEPQNYLLSEKQLKNFINGTPLSTEVDEKGDRGCYYINSKFTLDGISNKEWIIVADVDKDLTDVNTIREFLSTECNIKESIMMDIKEGTSELQNVLNENDGMQLTESKMSMVHHQANVLFNVMRGGYFYKSYNINSLDFINHVKSANIDIFTKNKTLLESFSEELNYDSISNLIFENKDLGLVRLWYEYLPLTFSRRHGDPSRPWNKFSIQTTLEDGTAKLDYQGNWRDIFQNWEALCYSYPEYIKHIIGKFLNASTKDGYNPYRISKDGIDWECPEPGNPWANIGYWSDHQIIYLLKLLEVYNQHKPQNLKDELNRKVYTFANVPYEIKSFKEILKDPYETIIFDEKKDSEIREFVNKIGFEGKMLHSKDGDIILSSMSEKLLIHLLTKLSNFIPEGGIWMNTQRPEWNDANNALVGKGISVVTLAYLRRFISFMIELYSDSSISKLNLTEDISTWLNTLSDIFSDYKELLPSAISDNKRFILVESLGTASETYRSHLYNSDEIKDCEVSIKSILKFLTNSLECVDDTLNKNKRKDDLFHSYNTLEINNRSMTIHNLYEMLEGQVAILSSGLLKPNEAIRTFKALRNSSMYRSDQHSYMLYPNRELPGFIEKNVVPNSVVDNNKILKELILQGNKDIIKKDIYGQYHFNGAFHNAKEIKPILDKLNIKDDTKSVEHIFETTFNHQAFTGRSGTFFAYEGLGSIYWHMVSKLLLAAQENLFRASDLGESKEVVTELRNHYYDIREGIGYNKSAEIYGAFPFDPYSHTPFNKGAKQPGMTGQVKEEVITRMAEMGIRIISGEICFDPLLINEQEFLVTPKSWNVKNSLGNYLTLDLPVDSFAATHCQTPYIIKKGNTDKIIIFYDNNSKREFEGRVLPYDYSNLIFRKTGQISYLEIVLNF